MSSLPMAGLAYAVGSKHAHHLAPRSSASSPPPEYDNPPPSDPPEVAQQTLAVGPAPQELERALAFQSMKSHAIERSRYAAQGSLLLQSSQESQLAARSPDEMQFARQLYLTSLEYILRGVPTDLSEAEKETLARSVSQLYSRVGIEEDKRVTSPAAPDSDRTQQLIVQLCRGTAILIKISIPRIRNGLESAIEFEKQYHLLQRSGHLVSDSLMTVADRAARASFVLPDISRFSGFATVVLNGVTIGVSEGYRILVE